MPLHGQNGENFVSQSFDHIIYGTADRDQPVAHAACGLMVGGIYHGACAVELIKEIQTAQFTAPYGMKLVAVLPFVRVGGVDVLYYVAAEMHVDQLQSLTDAQHGLFLCHKTGKKPQLQDIKLGINVSGTAVFLTEKGGRYVAAAGEKQMGGLTGGFGIEDGAVENAPPFQRLFLVFCIFASACDYHRRLRGHGAGSFCGGKDYFIICRRRILV